MTNLRKWQICGAIGIVLAYIAFVMRLALIGWVIMGVVGVIELIVIWVYDNTITRFWRGLYGKTADRITLFALIFLTWWLAGELAAGFFVIGLLNSHFHEHE